MFTGIVGSVISTGVFDGRRNHNLKLGVAEEATTVKLDWASLLFHYEIVF